MDLLDLLTAASVAPFTGALAAVLAVGIVELALALTAGAGLSDVLDGFLDSHPLPDTSYTNWLFVKEVPLLMVLLSLLTGYGLAGMGAQLMLQFHGAADARATSPWAYAAAVLGALLLARVLAGAVAGLKLVHTTALTPAEFIGGIAKVTSPTARQGYAATASFTDKNGYTHHLLVEPSNEYDEFVYGDTVQLATQVSVSLYRAHKVNAGGPFASASAR